MLSLRAPKRIKSVQVLYKTMAYITIEYQPFHVSDSFS